MLLKLTTGLKYKIIALYRSMHFSLNDAVISVVDATDTEDVEILAQLIVAISGEKKLQVLISSTFFSHFFHTNVVLAALFLVTCMLRVSRKSCQNDVRTKKVLKKH